MNGRIAKAIRKLSKRYAFEIHKATGEHVDPRTAYRRAKKQYSRASKQFQLNYRRTLTAVLNRTAAGQ